MGFMKFANNATSTLAGNINSSVTALSVAPGDAGKFPTLAAGDWFNATLVDAAGNKEIVKVTARATAVFTVVRGQEGTAARSWLAGDRIDLRVTAKSIDDIQKGNGMPDVEVFLANIGLDEVDNTSDADKPVSDAVQALFNVLPWLSKAIGEFYVVDTSKTGAAIPPNDDARFRYVKLTAGDAYNTGALSSESVSGSAPTITATATVSLSGSPMAGDTINLLNTEGRFLRGSTSSGTLQESANLSHVHTGATGSENTNHSHSGSTGTESADHAHNTTLPWWHGANGVGNRGGWSDGDSGGGSFTNGTSGRTAAHVHSFTTGGVSANHQHAFTSDASGGTEARPRNLGVTIFMRIK